MSVRSFLEGIRGRRILVFADFIDPFCYIGIHTLMSLAHARRIVLEWRGFELNAATPPEGLFLATAANSDLRPGMWASLQALAQRSGLAFSEPRWVPNTRRAHKLVEWAKKQDVNNPLIERIYQAYFMERKDIGQTDVLIDLAKEFSLDINNVKASWTDPRLDKALDQHRADAKKYGLMGLPGFVYKGKKHFGALSRNAWEEILGRGRAG